MVLKKTFRPHKIFGQNLLSQTVLALKNWEKKNCSKFFLVIQVKKKINCNRIFSEKLFSQKMKNFFQSKRV